MQKNTVLHLSKLIAEILRKKPTDSDELKLYFEKEKWDEIEPKLAEHIYLYIVSSPFISKLTLNRAMGLTSSFDMFSGDV